MSKFSVKKPFTVLVMVIAILVLGAVSAMRMQLDLLPEISLPYIMVITTYPGASPERIESQICEPMESSLGTISGVKNVYSISYENYGLVELEFADGTDMDSAMVKVSSSLDAIKDYLPEDSGTPTVMEISMDMMATQYLAVAYDGMSIEELSDFAESEVIPALERQDGVASVSSIGIVDKSIQVELDPEKVDRLNDKILAKTDDAFAEALEQLEDAEEQLKDSEDSLSESKQKLYDSQKELEDGKQELIDGQKELDDGKKELDDAQRELDENRNKLAQSKTDLENGKQAYESKKSETERQLAETETSLLTAKSDLEASKMHVQLEIQTLEGYNSAINKINDGITTIDNNLSPLNSLKSNIDSLSGTYADFAALEAGDPTNAAVIEGTLTAMGIPFSASTSLSDASAAVAGIIAPLETQKADLQAQLSSGAYGTVASNNAQIEILKASLPTIESNLAAVNDGLVQLYAGNIEAAVQLANAASQITIGESQITAAESQIDAGQEQIDSGRDSLVDAQKQIDDGWDQLKDGQKQIDEGWDQLKDGQKQIDDGWEQYYDSLESFEKQKAETLRHANADDLLSLATLAQLIYAQNFEMPAGYIDDKDDNSWLLKVGENYDSIEDLENMVLCNIDDIGDVHLKDVATITVIDNSLESYSRLNSDDAVILSIFKSSTSGTNEVSRTCKAAIEELEEQFPGLSILVIMDQGDYINIIIKSLLQSMLLGAGLAIVILAIFLKDVKPTIVVALSIPLSVLTAVVALYFSGISLNMMSLSGLALGIGMLVDNSIVVMENIYRLRGRGIEAPRAAVQGTKQVTGSIVASTLTTVAVFFPLVFTTGLVNELMMPMALSIIFCLAASLLVSMTLVPATCSTLLRNTKTKEHKLFEKIQNIYANVLDFCLRVKWIPLLIAVLLLALSIWRVVSMGVVMIPDMTSNEMQMSITMPDEMNREECYELADEVLEQVLLVENIGSIGVMSGGEATLIAAGAGTDIDFRSYQFLIMMEDADAGHATIKKAMSDIEDIADNLMLEDKGCEFSIASSMMDTSSLLGSGLTIDIYGDDLNELVSISEDIMEMTSNIEGFEDITNGQETPDQVIHLTIDKNKAMSLGISVAQIFSNISEKLDNEKSSVTVNVDGEEMEIVVVTNIDPLTYENLMDFPIEVSKVDSDDGNTYTYDVTLGDLAKKNFEDGVESINRKNQTRYITVSAGIKDGYNTTLLTRKLEPTLTEYQETKLPEGYILNIGGEYDTVKTMIKDMALVLALGALLIYLVMVAQFQSLLSPFIVIFTVPLAFTGGLIGLWVAGENLSMMGLMGFLLLLGTVVNNGIVFVDYVNQLRKEGLDRHTALIATGKTRMRPILMTALTTILAMSAMIFGDDMGSQMGKGMAIVVAGGLLYATLMTLFIIPVMYDILYKKQPLDVDLGSESLDDVPDDAAEFAQNYETVND